MYEYLFVCTITKHQAREKHIDRQDTHHAALEAVERRRELLGGNAHERPSPVGRRDFRGARAVVRKHLHTAQDPRHLQTRLVEAVKVRGKVQRRRVEQAAADGHYLGIADEPRVSLDGSDR